MRLQQGTNALLRLWSHDPNWQAEYVVKFFDENLDKHFRIEEELIFPLAGKYSGIDPKAAAQLLAEHGELRSLVEFFRHPSQERLRAELSRFGAILEGHIRAEERDFFPSLEERLSSEELELLGRKIRSFPGKES